MTIKNWEWGKCSLNIAEYYFKVVCINKVPLLLVKCNVSTMLVSILSKRMLLIWGLKVGNAGNGVNEFQYLNLLIMPAHKKSYHVSYANNICVSLLHAS